MREKERAGGRQTAGKGENFMDRNQIERAAEQFRALLEAQCARAEKLREKKPSPAPDKLRIGLIDGDGIGPVIMREAKRVLCFLLREELKGDRVEIVDIPGLTIENRMKLGQSVPTSVLEEIKTCPLLLKGPTETPKGGTMESANVTLRRELDLFSNVRPVRVKEKGIDWTFFRENTEGEYALGSAGIEIPGLLAVDFKVTTDEGTRRIARAAFDYAAGNGKTRVTIVTKANILKKTDGKFSEICREVAKDYPGIAAEDYYIDIMCANLLNEEIRSGFQVFVLPNLYGDIITDEAAQIQGGVGTAGSANVGDRYAMFEAVHGSAPRLVEAGLGEYASPESILRAEALLLSHAGFARAAERLNGVLDEVSARVLCDGTAKGNKASDFGDAVLAALAK